MVKTETYVVTISDLNDRKNDQSKSVVQESSCQIPNRIQPFVCIICCLIGSLAMCGLFTILKKIEAGPQCLATSRLFMMWLCCIPLLSTEFKSLIVKEKKKIVFARCLLGAISFSISVFSIKHLPIADLFMIAASSSMFTCFHARIVLKEPIDKLNIFNVFLVLAGLTLIVKPPFIFGEVQIYKENPLALYSALALILNASVLLPLTFVAFRFLRGWTEHLSPLKHQVFIDICSRHIPICPVVLLLFVWNACNWFGGHVNEQR